jgi:DNA helicase HerA-like ATPase
VIEEAHHFLREYIPEVPKSAITILGKSIRELRKKGIGFLVISHKVSDFEGNIRASINTKIYMRTGYEPDLQRIRSFHGSSYAKVVEKLPVGFAMIHYAEHNHGKPYFIKFKEYKASR